MQSPTIVDPSNQARSFRTARLKEWSRFHSPLVNHMLYHADSMLLAPSAVWELVVLGFERAY